MSDEKKEAAEAAPPADGKKKAAGPAPMVLIAVAAVALVAGAGTGAFVVAPRFLPAAAGADSTGGRADGHGKSGEKGGKDHGKKDAKGGGHGEKSSVYRVDNLIVNPAGSQGQRFLMASVAFEFDDAKINEAVREREVEVRDRIITTFESHSLDELTRPGARDSLRSKLARVMQPLVGEDVHFQVFLPQFVIQ
jgi:flagellar basal body-associated protein FliL